MLFSLFLSSALLSFISATFLSVLGSKVIFSRVKKFYPTRQKWKNRTKCRWGGILPPSVHSLRPSVWGRREHPSGLQMKRPLFIV